jgi:Xaa-Pro aminopeptidase
MDHEGRLGRLSAALPGRGFDAALVTDLTNVRYLTGYIGTNATVLVSAGRRLLFTDSRYLEAARAQTRGVEVVKAGRDLLERVSEAVAEVAPGGRVGVEADHLTLARFERLSAGLPGVELVAASGLVEDLRVVKEPAERELMREAARLGDLAYSALGERPLAGRTEREVAFDLELVMRRAGADSLSFPVIVAAAENGARPHAVPRDVPIPRDTLVVVDLGCVVQGYCSDCTRTFATGPLPDALAEAYDVCLRAQAAALEACRPGISCGDLDGVARGVVSAAGLGERFEHGLGHGVGLDIHERPWARQNVAEVLAEGMALTIEPGVYLPGAGGVRIEDLVIVEAGGASPLSAVSTELTRR